MKTIFDPVNRWIGSDPLSLASGNKRPVALADSLTIFKNSGPANVDVLANDFDPEGSALTLLSAFAALGEAAVEADQTITYTPPLGVSGSDTVLYEVADDLGQTHSGQLNVTINEPLLSISQSPDNILTVNAQAGLLDITVTDPAHFAGTYQVTLADLAGGPVNLVLPVITGTLAEGQLLTADPGLWVFDSGAGVPVASWQWLKDGAEISGAISASYTVQAGDLEAGLSVRQILSDDFGQRFVDSVTAGQSFLPSDDAGLQGWWDASDAASLTVSSGVLSSWSDKAGGAALAQTDVASQPLSGTRQLNGLNVIDFNGAHFLSAGRSLPVSGDLAFHMVVAVDSVDNLFDSLLSVNASNDFQLDALNSPDFNGRLNVSGIGSSVNLTGGPYSGAFIMSLVFDQSGTGQAEVFIANQTRATMAYTTAIDSAVTLYVMTNRGENARLDGAVGELIITTDLTNRTSYHDYLANKWGLL